MRTATPAMSLAMAVALAGQAAPVFAVDDDLVIDVGGISFEELINTTITSASKREERLQDAAAAVYVLTNDDIRRAHVTTIPDALRLVPGVEVTQTDSNGWGVSIRGFNTGVFANKLLVLIDGRAVYDPLFSGTFWEIQDVVLEDVDRIEVIRGPGGTLWGSNAVNGVINITTKSAKDTQGGQLVAGTGTEERVYSSLRYGTDLGNGRFLRVYGKFNERDESWNAAGAQDDWRIGRGGFRYDADAGVDHYTIQGDLYDGRTGPTTGATDDTRYFGSNLIARWTRNDSDGDGYALQFYWDNTDLDTPALEQQRDVLDLDFQRTHAPKGAHKLVWGLGYRFMADDVPSSAALTVTPENSEDTIWSLFAQDEIALGDDLRLTLGTKFENNSFTGWEIQPNARIAWTQNPDITWWSAVSRAVRTPSRLESDVSAATLVANDHLRAEELLSFELGNRRVVGRNLQLDMTAFVNDYDNLVVFEQTAPPALVPLTADNALKGRVYGLEVASSYQVSDDWRLKAHYTWLQMNLKTKKGHNGVQSGVAQDSAIEESVAAHRINLISSLNLRPRLTFDTIVRFVDNVPSVPTVTGASTSVNAYTALDIGLNWGVTKDLELELSARNLLDNHHPEAASATRGEIQQSIFGKITWNF